MVSAIHYPISCARAWQWALRELGHEVTTVGPAFGPSMPWPLTGRYDYRPYEWKPDINASSMDGRNLYFDLRATEKPDLILQLDHILLPPAEWKDVPNVLWAIDNHVGDYSEVAQAFSHIYIAHSWGNMKDLLGVKWLPAGYDDHTHYVMDDNADWLNAARHEEDHAEIHVRQRVGVYKLHAVHTVEGVIESKIAKLRKR